MWFMAYNAWMKTLKKSIYGKNTLKTMANENGLSLLHSIRMLNFEPATYIGSKQQGSSIGFGTLPTFQHLDKKSKCLQKQPYCEGPIGWVSSYSVLGVRVL